MSEDRLHSPRARKLNEEAAAWLARANSGNWGSEDQASLDEWLADSRANRVAYWRLESAWMEAARLAALNSAKPQAENSAPRYLPLLLRIAAAATIVAGLGVAAANYLFTPRVQTYATGIGGHETLKLADGSRIELNTDTVVRLANIGGERKVWLDKGEAYFQIKHDAAHPFVVIAGQHKITDLGTEFLIRNDAKNIEVALFEGRARFDNGNNTGPLRTLAMVPGDMVMATANSVSVTKRPLQELGNDLSWRQGLLVFNYTTLADAASEFNRYNSKKLVVADPAAARLTIIGKFPADDVELFSRVAKKILGVRVEEHNDEIVISR